MFNLKDKIPNPIISSEAYRKKPLVQYKDCNRIRRSIMLRVSLRVCNMFERLPFLFHEIKETYYNRLLKHLSFKLYNYKLSK